MGNDKGWFTIGVESFVESLGLDALQDFDECAQILIAAANGDDLAEMKRSVVGGHQCTMVYRTALLAFAVNLRRELVRSGCDEGVVASAMRRCTVPLNGLRERSPDVQRPAANHDEQENPT